MRIVYFVKIILVDLHHFPGLWAYWILWFSKKHFASYSTSRKTITTHICLVHPDRNCGVDIYGLACSFSTWLRKLRVTTYLCVSSSHLSVFKLNICMLCCVHPCMCSYYCLCSLLFFLSPAGGAHMIYICFDPLLHCNLFLFVYSRLRLFCSRGMCCINMLIIIISNAMKLQPV